MFAGSLLAPTSGCLLPLPRTLCPSTHSRRLSALSKADSHPQGPSFVEVTTSFKTLAKMESGCPGDFQGLLPPKCSLPLCAFPSKYELIVLRTQPPTLPWELQHSYITIPTPWASRMGMSSCSAWAGQCWETNGSGKSLKRNYVLFPQYRKASCCLLLSTQGGDASLLVPCPGTVELHRASLITYWTSRRAHDLHPGGTQSYPMAPLLSSPAYA